MASYLPISLVTNVTTQYTQAAFKGYVDNSIAIISKDTPLAGAAAYGSFGRYVKSSAVAENFGISSETALQADAIFAQTPNVLTGGGYVAVIPVKKAIDTVTLAAAGTLYEVDDVLTVVQSGAVAGMVKVATIVAETGAIATLTVLSGGHDYTVAIGVALSGGSGSAATINITAVRDETVVEVVARTQYQVYYRGIVTTFDQPTGTLAAAMASIAALKDKIIGIGMYVYADAITYGTAITSAKLSCARVIHYGLTSAQKCRLAVAAAMGRALSTNYTGSNTCITMHLKDLVGVTPDTTITQTTMAALDTAGVDAYPAWQWSDTIGSGYWSAGANMFFDQVTNSMWLTGAMQTNVFNLLKTTNTKIPQTERGMASVRSAVEQIARQAVRNGYLAAGTWTANDTFGDPETFKEQIELFGFYTYSVPVSEQTSAQRATRKAPLTQFAGKESGALHSADILNTINP